MSYTTPQAPEPDATAMDWKAECQYCADQTDLAVAGRTSRAFNNDPACLRRYILMQQATADRQKKYDVVEYLGHCIDDLSFALDS